MFEETSTNEFGKLQRAILVVDADPFARELATHVIRKLGYVPLQAIDGDEALRVAEVVRVDIALLLTSVALPTLSGFELAKRLKERCPGIKVIYMSGPEDCVQVCGPVHPGSAPLVKPFTREGLAYQLGMLLSGDVPEKTTSQRQAKFAREVH